MVEPSYRAAFSRNDRVIYTNSSGVQFPAVVTEISTHLDGPHARVDDPDNYTFAIDFTRPDGTIGHGEVRRNMLRRPGQEGLGDTESTDDPVVDELLDVMARFDLRDMEEQLEDMFMRIKSKDLIDPETLQHIVDNTTRLRANVEASGDAYMSKMWSKIVALAEEKLKRWTGQLHVTIHLKPLVTETAKGSTVHQLRGLLPRLNDLQSKTGQTLDDDAQLKDYATEGVVVELYEV